MKTFGGEARRYFASYPQSRPRTALDVIVKAHPEFGLLNRRNLLNEARQYKYSANGGTKPSGSAPAPPEGESSPDVERVDTHRNVWPSRKGAVSHWLRDAIVKAAALGIAGWHDTGMPNKMLVCHILGSPHKMVFFPTTRRLIIYAGIRSRCLSMPCLLPTEERPTDTLTCPHRCGIAGATA